MIGTINRAFSIGFLVIVCLTFSELNAQEYNNIGVLELARQAASEGGFAKAIELLQKEEKQHPHDVNVQQLLAHSYYWSGNLKMAELIFEKTIAAHPEQKALHLDYGRMLFEIKKYEDAKTHLLAYLNSDPSNAEALLNLGYIHFWNEEYKTAEGYFKKLLVLFPGQAEAVVMMEKIQAIQSVYIDLFGNYNTDSQPFTFYKPTVSVSKYWNKWLHPFINGSAYFFDVDSGGKQAQLIELGNHFYFKKVKTTLTINSGFYRNQIDGQIDFTGEAVLKKQLTKGLSISANASRTPNLTTLASLDQSVFQNEYAFQFDLSNGDSWMGQAAVGQKNHGDQNPILSAYAWAMSPAFKISVFQFRAGYAFNLSDSKESRFRNELPLSEIIAEWQEGTEVKGIYDPYFTPESQQIHAALAYLKINISKKINLELNANVGLFAQADLPFLYLDQTGNELEVKTDFFTQKENTIDLSSKFEFEILRNTWLISSYRYENTFFYDAHSVTIGLKTNFDRN